MSGVPVSAIRSRVATALDTITGWTESRHAPDRFGRETNQLSHRLFAVAVTESSIDETRQRRGTGALASTTVDITWSWRLRPDAVVPDTTEALDAEALLISTVLSSTDRDGLSSITLTRATRSSTPEGTYLVGELRFRVVHRHPLAS